MGRMCRDGAERGEDVQVSIIPPIPSFPPGSNAYPPSRAGAGMRDVRGPAAADAGSRKWRQFPAEAWLPSTPFLIGSPGNFRSLHVLGCDPSVILLSFLQMATCGL